MNRIGPLDPLEIGTKVCVGSKLGEVIKCDYVQAHPCGMIYVHTIRFTERQIPKRLRSGHMTMVTEPIKPFESRINYANISVV